MINEDNGGAIDRRTFLAEATALTTGLIVSGALAAPVLTGAPTIPETDLVRIYTSA